MATANYVLIDGVPYSPKHPKALAQNYEANPKREVSDTESQCDQEAALGTAVQGKAKGVGRVRVCFTGFRVRPIDPDNFAGSCKDCIDFLRHSGLIQGDEPWRIILETEQVRVKAFAEEMTRIEIEYPT